MTRRTIGMRELEREVRRARKYGSGIAASNSDDDLPKKPKTREGCASVPRPCPFASCRYNLLLDVNNTGGIRFSRLSFAEGADSCALDVADKGPQSYDSVGRLMLEDGQTLRILTSATFAKLKDRVSLQELKP